MSITKFVLVAETELLTRAQVPVDREHFDTLENFIAHANNFAVDGLFVSIHIPDRPAAFQMLLDESFITTIHALRRSANVPVALGYNPSIAATLPTEPQGTLPSQAAVQHAVAGLREIGVIITSNDPQDILEAAGLNSPSPAPTAQSWTPPSNPFASTEPAQAPNPFGQPPAASNPPTSQDTQPRNPFGQPAAPAPVNPFDVPTPQQPTPPPASYTPPTPPASPDQAPSFMPVPREGASQIPIRPVDRNPAPFQPSPSPTPFQPAPPQPSPQFPHPAAPPHPGSDLRHAPAVPGGFQPAALPGVMPTSHHTPKHRGVVLLFVAPKGGTGKSTISQNVAAYIARHATGNLKVAWVDLNLKQGDSLWRGGFMTEENARKGRITTVRDLFQNIANVTPETIHHYLMPYEDHPRGPWFLLPPMDVHRSSTADTSIYNAAFWTTVFNNLRQAFDYIIIDTGSLEMENPLHKLAEDIADRVCWVFGPSPDTVAMVKERIDSFTQESRRPIDYKKHGWILNSAFDNVGFDDSDVARIIGYNEAVHFGTIPFDTDFVRASVGQRLVFSARQPRIDLAFHELISNITEPAAIRSVHFDNSHIPREGADTNNGVLGKLRGLIKKR